MSVTVKVLGSCGAYPRPGRACSGFLLQCEGRNLVLDLGSGSLANLFMHISPEKVDGVVITHLHYDHFVDIYGLYVARRFWESRLAPLPVLVPGASREVLGSLLSGTGRDEFFEYLHVTEAQEGLAVDLAGFEVTAQAAEHVISTLMFRVAVGGRVVCYTGDTDWSDAAIEIARDADLFICEATFTSEITAKPAGHLFASEAGRMAREAGVKSLLLTHVWPTLDEETAVSDAGGEFAGPVTAAVEGLTLEI